MSTILVIDDDPYIRELVCHVLAGAGFGTLEATDGRDAFDQLGGQPIDLAVVDSMMPRMDGLEFCRTARRYYPEMPLLMLTARGDTASKVDGLHQGADDYLVKPFEAPELVARVKALLRRYQKVAEQRAQAGILVLDKASYTVTVATQPGREPAAPAPAALPLKEFDLLFALAAAQGRTLSRNQLLDDVWGYDFNGNERTLDVHINRLRERFDPAVYGFKITTVRGLGYRLEPAE